jgi:hypothetical protein
MQNFIMNRAQNCPQINHLTKKGQVFSLAPYPDTGGHQDLIRIKVLQQGLWIYEGRRRHS